MSQSPTIWQRISWSIGCALLGAGLVWAFPTVLCRIPWIYQRERGGFQFAGLLVALIFVCECVFCFLGGAIAGAWRPGRLGVFITVACVLAGDVFFLVFGLIYHEYSRLVFLHFVSAALKAVILILLWQKRQRTFQEASS